MTTSLRNLEFSILRNKPWNTPQLNVHKRKLLLKCISFNNTKNNKIPLFMLTKSLQSCPTHCDPMDRSPPGSSGHGILQARYWSGVPRPPPGGLPDPRITPTSLMSPALAGGFFTTGATWEALVACVSAPASSMLMSSTYVLHVPNSILEMKQERLREVQQLFQGHRAELGFPPGPLSLGCFARLPVQ